MSDFSWSIKSFIHTGWSQWMQDKDSNIYTSQIVLAHPCDMTCGDRMKWELYSRAWISCPQVPHIGGQIPQNGLTLGPCPQWGLHYYIILNYLFIDGLYLIIWYVDIMQQLRISQNNDWSECVWDSWGNVRNSGGNVCNSGGMSATVGEMSATVGKLNMI